MRLTFLRFARLPQLLSCVVLLVTIPQGHLVAAEVAKRPKSSVSDLRYGVALYQYYQQDYLQALSELMVADARDGIQGHGDNPELITASISLAFGMENHAEKLFNELLQGEKRPQSVRDSAWFYLGKLQYARANWPAAEQSFNRVSNKLSAYSAAEMKQLKINIHIKNNQFAPITIEQVKEGSLAGWEPYALYNLGAAQARAGNTQTAQEFFRELEKTPFDSENQTSNEHLGLLDKTYTAKGYSLIREKQYAEAVTEFKKVRLEGLESNQALLGYGWAAIAQEKYADAVKPWQLLQQRSLLFAAAQEALLALPFAYEKLNAPGDALREYEKAEKLLDLEISLVQNMRATLTSGELLTLVASKPVSVEELKEIEKTNGPETLTALITDDGQNWLKIGGLSIIKTHSIYLRELFSHNEFQTSVLDLRDLLKLQKLLQQWSPKLLGFIELLEQKQALRKQQDFNLRKPANSQATFIQREAELQKKRNTLVARIDAIYTNDDYLALADEQTRKSYAAIERSESTIQRLKAAGESTSEYTDKLNVFRGMLQWRAAQDYPAGIWDLEDSVNHIDKSLEKIKSTRAHIEQMNSVGLDIQPLTARIRTQESQLQRQLVSIDKAISIRGELLREKVDKQLGNHEKRLTRYLSQSRLAIARLYDTALRNQENGNQENGNQEKGNQVK
jgi:hypothetical protein